MWVFEKEEGMSSKSIKFRSSSRSLDEFDEEDDVDEDNNHEIGEGKGNDEKTVNTLDEVFDNLSFNSYNSDGGPLSVGTRHSMDDASSLASTFTSDIAETMHLLREVTTPPYAKHEQTLKSVLSGLQIICKERFEAKKRLGQSGAANHLLEILKIYRKNPQLLSYICEAISEFMYNENDNKIFMGAVGLVEEIKLTFPYCEHSPILQSALIKLIIDCCHNRIKGLLKRYCPPKRPPSRGTEIDTLNQLYPDYIDIDNRAKIGEIGICKIIMKLLKPFITMKAMTNEDDLDDPANLIILLSKSISTLSTNDNNAKLFGEYHACEVITRLLGKKKLSLEHYVHLLWSLIILCSDCNNDNKIKFGHSGVCKILIEHLHEVQRTPSFYSKDNFFNKYMEYLAWSLTNLIRGGCKLNIQNIRNITYAEVTIDNILSIDVVPRGAKIKLNQVYIDIYEKYKPEPTEVNVSDEQKTYITQPQSTGNEENKNVDN